MHIVRHRQGLALGSGGSGGELARLHPVIEPQFAKIEERRQNAVDTVVEEVVELPLRRHHETHHRNLHLVLLQGDIIAMEVTAVVDVAGLGIDNRVVAG